MSEETLYTEERVHNEETGMGEAVSKETPGTEGDTEIVTKDGEDEPDLREETIGTEKAENGDEADPGEIIGNREEAGAEEMAEQEWNAAMDQREKKELDYFEDEPKKRGFFRRNKEEEHFLRDKWILSRIRDEDLMDYLVLEQKRNEQMQKAKDIREKRIISAFKLSVSLAAGVAVVYLLKDNPTIFVNILYIGGILGGFHFWKNSQGK